MKEIDITTLTLDEFEVLRFCDLDGLDQSEAGKQMGISRGTVQRLLYSARRKVVGAILDNNALMINLKQGEHCDVGVHTHERRPRPRRRAV